MTHMTSSERKTGVQGATVAANVKRLMEEQNLNSGSLARKIAEIDQPTELADGTAVKPAKLADLAIRRIVAGERKVDVDDLVLLAYALGVAPVTLMQPQAKTAGQKVLAPVGEVSAIGVWEWMIGRRPPESMQLSSVGITSGYWDLSGHLVRYILGVVPAWSDEAGNVLRGENTVRSRDLRTYEQRLDDGEQPMF